jgi:translation initiation factor IF-1
MRGDMVPRGGRSIRDIPVPASVRRREAEVHSIEEDYMERHAPPRRVSRRGRGRWFLFSLIAVVIICAIGGLLLSTLFAGATITVYPRTAQVTAPKTLIAKLNPSPGELGVQLMSSSRAASTTVNATGTHQVSRSAVGDVTIYNGFSTASQRLITSTRFEAPDGKIYKVHEPVTIPGAIKNPDGSMTPGSVSAKIYAESPGESYNRGNPTKYTIPGFKDEPAKYTKFYAMGSAMGGGFVGTEPAVADSDLTAATDALKQGLSKAAQDSLTAQIPEGYIAVPGTLQVSFSGITQTPASNNTATIAQTATMSGAIVKASDLAAAVAKETVSDYKGEAIGFADAAQISVAAATSTKPGEPITLMLSGTPLLVWQFDPNAIKSALLGKPKADFESIIQSFAPAIECTKEKPCEAKVRPLSGLVTMATSLVMDTQDKEVQGTVEEALPNTLFRVNLETGENILAYLAGKMRLHRIKVLVGDKVTVKIDPYGGKGRITRRL